MYVLPEGGMNELLSTTPPPPPSAWFSLTLSLQKFNQRYTGSVMIRESCNASLLLLLLRCSPRTPTHT